MKGTCVAHCQTSQEYSCSMVLLLYLSWFAKSKLCRTMDTGCMLYKRHCYYYVLLLLLVVKWPHCQHFPSFSNRLTQPFTWQKWLMKEMEWQHCTALLCFLFVAVLVGLYEEPEKPNDALEYPSKAECFRQKIIWNNTWGIFSHVP